MVRLKSDEAQVSLLPLPYPYRAAIAICSDLDETPNREVYWETMKFLNTTEPTAMGPGVGLEVGNSIYFDMPPAQFSYWNTDDAGREMIRTLIRSGHIDCLHSFGDLATTRAHAQRALDEMIRHDCRLEVWVDHATAPTNFGSDIMCGHGDEPTHEAYHADLTIAYGIRFVWRGRVTSVWGQEVPADFGGMWSIKRPIQTTKTLAKEAAKHLLGRWGDKKYAAHAPNRVLWEANLRDGSRVFEFLRSNPHCAGVSCGDNATGIAEVVTDERLDRLVQRMGLCVLYTHLGKARDPSVPFENAAVVAFRRLAKHYRNKNILVMTTRRLLRYLEVRDHLSWSVRFLSGEIFIDIHKTLCGNLTGELSREDLCGLTFDVPAGTPSCIVYEGEAIKEAVLNLSDHTGRASISIPWHKLKFPDGPH